METKFSRFLVEKFETPCKGQVVDLTGIEEQ